MADPWLISFLFFTIIFLPVVVVYFAYKHEEPIAAPCLAEIGMPPVPATAALTSPSLHKDRTRRRRRTKNQESTVGDLGPRSTVPSTASAAVVSSDRPSRRRRGGVKTLGEASGSGGVPSPPGLGEQRMIVQEICEVGLEKDVNMEGDLDVLCSKEYFGRKEDKRVEVGRVNDDSFKDEEEEGEKVVEPIEGDAKGKVDARELSETRGASLLHCDDEWEGIELSDAENLFRVATQFVDANNGADAVSRLSNELQMQLYGLRKVAIEGPCYEPQPMAFKVSSRSKWMRNGGCYVVPRKPDGS
ncbi:hypothetical protein ZIOFF_012488 [Zingiber officinale]|uniref:ACB domain-containing protein n=1 Tax=Zingiber officinale TaxID=94328 RepID=A0A8J5HT10_ZINOF|nr:hypothetical protein ZIOFF_012488 [Zingiber officinale]